MNESKDLKKVVLNVALVIVLIVCFLMITYALTKNLMSVDDNFFKTGNIKINLNDGKNIIDEDEFLFEPGMIVTKDFFIENQSTFDIYYKIYFADVSGDLSDILDVTIKKDDKILYEGTVNDLSRKKVKAVDDVLKIDEKVILNVSFYYPEDSQNNTQNSDISFRLGVDAVQTKNNPNKLFN